jgi:hypothetical protein
MKRLFKRTVVLILLVCCSYSVYSQVQQAWVATPFQLRSAVSVAPNLIDKNGNIYGGITFQVLVGASTASTFIISKTQANGTVLWRVAEDVSESINRYIIGLAVDGSGNVYCGVHESQVVDPVTPRLNSWFVVYKYDANGSKLWKRSYSDGESNVPHAMTIDAAGNIYLTGNTNESGLVQNNPTLHDFLTVKWNTGGTFQWARKYDGASPGDGYNVATAIAVDGSGNVYITGGSQRDGVIGYATIKYNSAGEQLWEQRYNGTGSGSDYARAITLDVSGFVYVTGESDGSIATIKYNDDGAEIWVQREGSGGGDGRAIKVDASGNVFVAGNSNSTTMAVVKYNFAGTKQWIKTRASSSAYSLDLDASGNAYAAGTGNDDALTIKYSAGGTEEWAILTDSPLRTGYSGPLVVSDLDNVYVITLTSTHLFGSTPQYYAYLYKYTQCKITCPSNITVNNDPGQCGAIVSFPDATATGDCGTALTYSHTSGSFFNVGTTTVTVSSDATGATCSFTITVVDNENPVITSCPASKTVFTDLNACYASAATVNAGLATATDNCNPAGVTGIRSDGLPLTANFPVGATDIAWRATDAAGNTATCTQTITVVDNQPPVISNESASTSILSPANHTMRDVTINYTVTDNCTVTSTLSVTSNEPVNGTGDGDTDPDWIVVDDHHVKLRAERAAQGNGRIYTITITAVDPAGNISTKPIEVRVPHDIRKPESGKPFKVGTTVAFEGIFWDKPGNKHTAKWLIDENTVVKAAVTEPNGNNNGKITGSYKFNSPGVYKLRMNTTDQNGITHYSTTNGDIEEIIVVYDPNGGYTYGGGFYQSQPGALVADPVAEGKASFGFTINYRNATNPKGETQFEFKVGSFEFNALTFDYLVISGAKAQFRGTGKIIGGQSGIGFSMTVIDGQLDGSGADKIRMKIYNRATNAIIYDNQPGASDADDPVTPVGINSEIFVQGNSNPPLITDRGDDQIPESVRETDLKVMAYPNPGTINFSLIVQSEVNESIAMQVVDMNGRIIQAMNVKPNSIIRVGENYKAGIYFIRLMQGKEHKEIKLIKLPG